MSFLLKIVEGPNKGAEIALVEGVAVTLGKGDDCDVVLADQTMPDVPLKVAASADGVAVDGEPLEPLAVKTLGATSFAIGPADSSWGELKWPKSESPKGEEHEARDESRAEEAPSRVSSPAPEEPPGAEEKKRRNGCVGCLVALLVLLLVLAGLVWLFWAEVKPCAESLWEKVRAGRRDADGSPAFQTSGGSDARASSISGVAAKYGLSFGESNGIVRLSGNLGTRRERLAATAEAYQVQPGVDLDLSDDESFRTAAEDALFTLSEGALKVAAATNRFLSVIGSSPSPLSLKKMLVALNADLPKLRDVDVSGVVISRRATESLDRDGDADRAGSSSNLGLSAFRRGKKAAAAPAFPVCGILTAPYPCLVMRDGRRIMEGAAIGDSVIVEIGADSVTLTNATGRFTWKP